MCGGGMRRREVKSAYSLMFDLLDSNMHLSSSEEEVFESIWQSPVPSKVVAFSWKLLHGRFPNQNKSSKEELLTDKRVLILLYL